LKKHGQKNAHLQKVTAKEKEFGSSSLNGTKKKKERGPYMRGGGKR